MVGSFIGAVGAPSKEPGDVALSLADSGGGVVILNVDLGLLTVVLLNRATAPPKAAGRTLVCDL